MSGRLCWNQLPVDQVQVNHGIKNAMKQLSQLRKTFKFVITVYGPIHLSRRRDTDEQLVT